VRESKVREHGDKYRRAREGEHGHERKKTPHETTIWRPDGEGKDKGKETHFVRWMSAE
jgi:hypothetical protein